MFKHEGDPVRSALENALSGTLRTRLRGGGSSVRRLSLPSRGKDEGGAGKQGREAGLGIPAGRRWEREGRGAGRAGMVAPERNQKGNGVGEAESVGDLKVHSFHKQWDNYYVPNAKCMAEKPVPATPAASYCLTGGLRTAAHGRTDGRTNMQAPAQDWPDHAALEPGLTGLGPQTRISAGPALPPLGGPRPGPARSAVEKGDTWPPRSARFSSAQSGRVVSGLPESPGGF